MKTIRRKQRGGVMPFRMEKKVTKTCRIHENRHENNCVPSSYRILGITNRKQSSELSKILTHGESDFLIRKFLNQLYPESDYYLLEMNGASFKQESERDKLEKIIYNILSRDDAEDMTTGLLASCTYTNGEESIPHAITLMKYKKKVRVIDNQAMGRENLSFQNYFKTLEAHISFLGIWVDVNSEAYEEHISRNEWARTHLTPKDVAENLEEVNKKIDELNAISKSLGIAYQVPHKIEGNIIRQLDIMREFERYDACNEFKILYISYCLKKKWFDELILHFRDFNVETLSSAKSFTQDLDFTYTADTSHENLIERHPDFAAEAEDQLRRHPTCEEAIDYCENLDYNLELLVSECSQILKKIKKSKNLDYIRERKGRLLATVLQENKFNKTLTFSSSSSSSRKKRKKVAIDS
jgi:hypothetical protein